MFARHHVGPALASAQVLACLATVVVTPLHAQTSKTGNRPQETVPAYSASNLRGHLLCSCTETWTTGDNFVQLLMGATPPDTYEMTRPPGLAGGPGGGAPDDDPSNWR